MTSDEIKLAQHLPKARFQPGSCDKRFCLDMAAIASGEPGTILTDAQRRTLLQLVHRYRRQLDPVYVKLAREMQLADTTPASEALGIVEAGAQGFEHNHHISKLELPG